MPDELYLIDGNSLAYRAFFALPESIATSTGCVVAPSVPIVDGDIIRPTEPAITEGNDAHGWLIWTSRVRPSTMARS